jgi:hypothetical protein
MTKIKLICRSLLATLLLTACGGKGSGSGPASGLSIQGNWTIATTSASGDSTLQISLVSSACSVTTPIGTFTVHLPDQQVCFIADNNTGQGSISRVGAFIYPPQGVLAGVPSNPIYPGTNYLLDLLFVEAGQLGDFAVFDGAGSVNADGTMTGTFTCDPGTPVCSGISGTFSGTQ